MIYIIITTSIKNKYGLINDSHRKNRYINSIQQLLQFIGNDLSIKPIIVENNGLRKTYLDDLNCDIFYTNNNETNLSNKGGIELLDIKDVIHKYNIQDDDMIIKITGRYKVLNLHFINLVKNNINNYDALVKFFNVCTKKYMFDDCVLGLFAIKCKYVKNFNYQFIRSCECEFASYIRNNIHTNRLMEIQDLNLECCFNDDFRILNV